MANRKQRQEVCTEPDLRREAYGDIIGNEAGSLRKIFTTRIFISYLVQ
jgi:hypothetical protein